MLSRKTLVRSAAVLWGSILLIPATAALAQERREIAVNVTDQAGQAVPGLTAANFRGMLEGQEVKIENVVVQGGQRHIYVLIDVSAGIRSNLRTWRLAWAAARDLIVSLPAPHKASVVPFSDSILTHRLIPTGAGEETMSALAQVEAEASFSGGATRLYDAILEAANLPQEDQAVRTYYVISDGLDTRSQTKLSALKKALGESESRVFFFLLPINSDDDPGALRGAGRKIAELAEGCGGMVVDFSRASDGQPVPVERLKTTYASMVRNYLLQVELPQRLGKPKGWQLSVVDAAGNPMTGVKLTYPRYLAPK